MNDTGTVEGDSGTLELDGGGSGTSGVIDAGTSGIVALSGSYSGSFSGSGAGAVQLVSSFTGTSGGVALDFQGSLLQWLSGTLSGAVTNAGTLTVAGSSYLFLTGTLTNTGTVNVTSSSYPIFGYANNATIDNQAGTTFDFQADIGLYDWSSDTGLTFNNAGTLEKTAGTGILGDRLRAGRDGHDRRAEQLE